MSDCSNLLSRVLLIASLFSTQLALVSGGKHSLLHSQDKSCKVPLLGMLLKAYSAVWKLPKVMEPQCVYTPEIWR